MRVLYPINYAKSIRKQRLIYKITARLIFSYIVSAFTSLAFFVLSVGVLSNLFFGENGMTTANSSLVLLLFILLFAFIIISFIFQNKLLKIVGIDKQTNSKEIISLLNQYYKLNNLVSDDKMVRDIKPYYLFSGRIITCLFDENNLYLNKVSLQNYNLMSPFMGVFNYYKCKRIAKRFKLMQ